MRLYLLISALPPSDDFQKYDGFSKQPESLTNKFSGSENIVILNGSVWKKHRMVSRLI
jgi:hypothetical protein